MSETGYRTFQEMIDDSSDEEDISVAIDTQENVVVPRHRTFAEMLNEDASDDPALEQEFLGQQAAEEYYFRTREAPYGYEVKGPSVPTDDTGFGSLGISLGPISESKIPQSEKNLFTYERTAQAYDQFNAPVDDVLSDEEFLARNVPDYLRPFVSVVAAGVDGVIVKPSVTALRGLNTGLLATGETLEGSMAAFTRAVQEGIIEGSTFERLTGLTGKDLIPFDPETSGRKFVGDLIQLAEVADAPAVAVTAMAKAGATAQMRKFAEDAGAITPDITTKRMTFAGGPIEEGSLVEKGLQSIGRDVKVIKGGDRVQTAEMLAAAEKARARQEQQGRISDIKGRTEDVRKAKAEAAAAEAAKHDDIMEELIHNYEDVNDLGRGAISKKAFGKTYIDFEKAKTLGIQKVEDLGLDDDVAYDLGIGPNGFRNPIFQSEKLNAVVATIAKVKELNPEAFKGSKNVIETLFRESVKGNLIASDELRKILDEFGLSLDDYILMTVGSGTKFGKGLQKFSAMATAMGRTKRVRSAGKKAQDDLDGAPGLMDWLAGKIPFEMGLKKTGQNIRRAENISRGLMVSAFATAARNFESTLIRAPLEGLTYVLQDAIIRGVRMARHTKAGEFSAAREEAVNAARRFNPVSKDNIYRDSFNTYSFMFSNPEYADDMTKFILEQPEFAHLLTRYRDQIIEAQRATGKGEGGISDFVFNPIEDFVDFLNTPNRGQEFLSRNAYFLSDLSRNLKREWGVNLEQIIRDGKIKELINDSPTLRPVRGDDTPPSFAELATDAVESALDKTYASPPTFAPFKSMLRILNGIPGSTIMIPFPRFMFKAMEYVGSNVAGGYIPALRIAMGKGNLVKDAEKVARNMVGMSALLGLYYYRRSEESPERYNYVTNPDGSQTNIDPQFPLAPGLYLAEVWNQIDKDFKISRSQGKGYAESMDDGFENLTNWMFMDRGRNFGYGIKALTGSNFRANQSFGQLASDVSNLFAENNDAAKTEETKKAFGKLVGNTVTRYFQPYSMVIDAERAMGMRDNYYKTYEGEPDLSSGSAFVKGFMIPLNARGYVSPGKEAAAPRRVQPMSGERERLAPTWKLALGINVERGDKPYEKYLRSLNFVDYDFSYKVGVDVIDNTMAALVNELLPDMANMLAGREPMLKARLKKEGRYSNKMMVLEQRNLVKNNFANIRESLRSAQFSGSSNPGYVMAVNAFRKLPSEDRVIALSRVQARRDASGLPDVNLGSIEGLRELIVEARRVSNER
jgi:hypothetical protein